MSIEVHIDWQGETLLVGRIHAADRSAAVSFEYDRQWLSRKNTFSIDPTTLPLQVGAHHRAELFGGIADCGPDRWGRALIERAVRKGVLNSKPFGDLDYVLALDDSSRIGALRFRAGPDGPFLAHGAGKLPPLVRLNALLRATEAIHGETETAEDLRFLLGEGSPLGGARPKSAVVLSNGNLAIAKFPKPDDVRDIGAGEILALHLARLSGIQVADHQLVQVSKQSVSVITRFDRANGRRIPFLSAHSLLDLSPGEAGAYTILADGIRQFGDNVAGDLSELWRRLIFSLLVSNYDDHMRNHGFLMLKAGRWSLSPAYDLNPVPEIERARIPKTAIDEEQHEPTIAGALSAAARFGLKPQDARRVLNEVFSAVSQWKPLGRKMGLKASTLEVYATAFEHPLSEEARRLQSTKL